MNKLSLRKYFQLLAVVSVCSFFLVSCVTENSGSSRRNIDTEKALELHNRLAAGYVKNKNRESARLHLKKAFALDKKSPEATLTLAELYQLEGELVLAEETYRQAIRLKRNFSDAQNAYGIFLYGLKRYEESLVQFEKAAADLDYKARAEALVNVGRTAMMLGNNARAKAAFEHASILDKRLAIPYLELADIHYQAQDFAQAKRYLDTYMSREQAGARALYLAIRLERIFGNKDKEASHALSLKNYFPYSKEYLEYKGSR
ncbi:MAG: type IV pilus biogenesis/stability protein PilW [Cellvibrio sp.]